jgi:hypothetical protein
VSRRIHQLEVDGLSIRTHQHPTLEGLELKADWLNFVEPVLPHLSAFLNEKGELNTEEIDFAQALPALQALARGVRGKELSRLVVELFQFTSVVFKDDAGNLKQVDLLDRSTVNIVFADKEMAFYKAIFHALKANFLGFFGGAGALKGDAIQTPSR